MCVCVCVNKKPTEGGQNPRPCGQGSRPPLSVQGVFLVDIQSLIMYLCVRNFDVVHIGYILNGGVSRTNIEPMWGECA